MTQCISRRRGSDLRPSIMRPVCFLQPARVRHVYCVSPYPPKPCQAPPPPWAALLLTGWWVYIPTLPLSQQSVAVDLPLRLVSVSCFHVPKCASSVLPLFLISLPVPCVLVILCSGSPHLQCSVPLSLPVLVCYPGYLAVPLLVWRVLSLIRQVPRRCGGNQ